MVDEIPDQEHAAEHLGMGKGRPVAPQIRRRLCSVAMARPKVNRSVSAGSSRYSRRMNSVSITIPMMPTSTGATTTAPRKPSRRWIS